MDAQGVGARCVMADPTACIGCKTCMAACLAKHDVTGDVAQARLNVISTAVVSAPVACRHCTGAPCASVCPTHALYKDGDRVAVETTRCIGCRGCVMACPFGAVDVVMQTTTETLGNLVLRSVQRPIVVKCDLCADRPGGPACVEACPTKGLFVVDQQKLADKVREKRREAASTSTLGVCASVDCVSA